MKLWLINIVTTLVIVLLLSVPAVQASYMYQTVLSAVSATFSSGPVLIGATARAGSETLYVKAGDDGVAAEPIAGTVAVFENDSGAHIAFQNPTNKVAGIYFNGGTGALVENSGALEYYNVSAGEDFRFTVGEAQVLRIKEFGIVDFRGTMANSAKDPTTDAPADWIQIQILGTDYYIPVYAAS